MGVSAYDMPWGLIWEMWAKMPRLKGQPHEGVGATHASTAIGFCWSGRTQGLQLGRKARFSASGVIAMDYSLGGRFVQGSHRFFDAGLGFLHLTALKRLIRFGDHRAGSTSNSPIPDSSCLGRPGRFFTRQVVPPRSSWEP